MSILNNASRIVLYLKGGSKVEVEYSDVNKNKLLHMDELSLDGLYGEKITLSKFDIVAIGYFNSDVMFKLNEDRIYALKERGRLGK